MTIQGVPAIVIVGGGFGGLAAAKALKHSRARVVLIDRENHHLFQPLLYQVATSELAPGQIGSPIRNILRNQANTTVLLGEVVDVDKVHRCVLVNSLDRQRVPVPYDYLILATGQQHTYLGHNEYQQFAPGLKTLADAVLIRSKILRAFEQAEAEEDPTRHRDLLTFVLVGAGPTGVEMAGAIAVLVRKSLKSEFRRIDPASARIVLVDKSERVLPAFFKTLSSAARARLEQLGVEVRLSCSVDSIDKDGVVIAGERISSRTVIWTAGITPSPAAKWLNAESDPAGRVLVKGDLTVPGYPDIFVVGDTSCCYQDGKPLPSVAHVAIQQGQYVGKLIEARLTNGLAPGRFSYFDKGNMAVIGKGFAVLQSGDFYISGASAWLTWAAVHLECLMRSSVRFSVFVQWLWTYLTGQRGSGLIIDQHGAQRPTAESDLPPGVKAA